MKIRLITVGKMSDRNMLSLAQRYVERIKHDMPISMEAVKAEKIASLSTGEIKKRETERILKKLNSHEGAVVLDCTGEKMTSEEFADFVRQAADTGKSQLSFIIGGPLGLSRESLPGTIRRLSLSKMTFPHELTAVLLLEQIYRAMSIIKGNRYHK
jgi:23S rRNA (pseudouridine1915-N3)-methyltransferase